MESLEMHGTGTPLGDPIEIGAALAVLRGAVHPVALSAVKSHVGHAEPAAGGVSLLQVPKPEHSPASRVAPRVYVTACIISQQLACMKDEGGKRLILGTQNFGSCKGCLLPFTGC